MADAVREAPHGRKRKRGAEDSDDEREAEAPVTSKLRRLRSSVRAVARAALRRLLLRGSDVTQGSGFHPLPVADTAVPFQRVLYLMRGPPGCGKSTAARGLLRQHLQAQGVRLLWGDASASKAGTPDPPLAIRAFIFSTDDYFTSVDEVGAAVYDFDPRRLRENHGLNQSRCEAAMEAGLRPLFVDNTNIALWEMQAYVNLADRFGYEVRVIDPRRLSESAFDIDMLFERCQSGRGRASGKDIGRHVFERMARSFEELPLPRDAPQGDPLEAIRQAAPPRSRRAATQASPPPPLYAGLDVEAQVLASFGGLDLGPCFWEELGREGGHYFDARCLEDGRGALSSTGNSEGPFYLPARLHITVSYFGRGIDEAVMRAAEDLVGSHYEVVVDALVAVRGGGLLCASCSVLRPDGSEASELLELGGDTWRPHVTLLTARGSCWQAVDSTAVLRGWEKRLRQGSAAEGGVAREEEAARLLEEERLRPGSVADGGAARGEEAPLSEAAEEIVASAGQNDAASMAAAAAEAAVAAADAALAAVEAATRPTSEEALGSASCADDPYGGGLEEVVDGTHSAANDPLASVLVASPADSGAEVDTLAAGTATDEPATALTAADLRGDSAAEASAVVMDEPLAAPLPTTEEAEDEEEEPVILDIAEAPQAIDAVGTVAVDVTRIAVALPAPSGVWELVPAVQVDDERVVDLCALRFVEPKRLSSCQFALFWR